MEEPQDARATIPDRASAAECLDDGAIWTTLDDLSVATCDEVVPGILCSNLLTINCI